MKRSPTVHRCFEQYSSEQCANKMASRRQGHRQRLAVGEFYYVSEFIPNIAYRTRGQAERAEQTERNSNA